MHIHSFTSKFFQIYLTLLDVWRGSRSPSLWKWGNPMQKCMFSKVRIIQCCMHFALQFHLTPQNLLCKIIFIERALWATFCMPQRESQLCFHLFYRLYSDSGAVTESEPETYLCISDDPNTMGALICCTIQLYSCTLNLIHTTIIICTFIHSLQSFSKLC